MISLLALWARALHGRHRGWVYISGPMTGIPDHNRPAFSETSRHLRALGFRVVSPADWPDEERWEDNLKRDLKALMDCDYVAVLPGWFVSRGASLEAFTAHRLAIPVLDAETLERISPRRIEEAIQRWGR